MADIEDAEGHQGAVREWLARAARAPRDKAWVADGLVSDRWAPASPSGTLDAFVWRTPDERLAHVAEPPIPVVEPEPAPEPPPIPPPPAAIAPPEPVPAPEPAPAIAPPAPAAPAATAAAPAPAPAPRPRNGIILDPATMAPDDPGPAEAAPARRGFRLFANE